MFDCPIPPFLFCAAVLIGNRSSDKAAGCWSIQTLLLWFLSLGDTNTHSSVMRVKSVLWILPFLSLQQGESYCLALVAHLNVVVCLPWAACRVVCLSPALFVFVDSKSWVNSPKCCLFSSALAGWYLWWWLWDVRGFRAPELLNHRAHQRRTRQLFTGEKEPQLDA